ncbi:MAG: leishmanolysin-related zinc metalloendopeptidase [Vicinamibacterales bacterium]
MSRKSTKATTGARKRSPGRADYDTYVTHKSVSKSASKAAIASAYTIEVRFLGGLTESQKQAFKKAADRWSRVIVGDLPSVVVNGEVIDDLLIEAEGVPIDGVGKILGQAGPRRLRPMAAGKAAMLPATGLMSFDTADLASMEADGTLVDVITHEMGHVIGIGTIWERKGLLAGVGTTNPTFIGSNAKKAFGVLRGTGPKPVPVENTGGPGTRDSHWRESVFRNELMSGFISEADNPLSRLTVASLIDLGYEVSLSAAEPYALPNLQSLAEKGMLAAVLQAPHAHALPIFAPKVLPDSSLV